MASYSRRINRPRGWQLEPFITYQDIYNVRQGNPGLKPEYVDSYEFGYLKKFNTNFFSIEAYYRVTHNKIERVSSTYTEITMIHTYQNVGQDFSLGLEGMLNLNVTKWWDMQISGNFYNYKLEGTLYDAPFSRSSTNWSSRFNNNFNLWKNGQLQLNSRYNSASVTAQGTSSGYYSLDAAFKVSFLDRALTVNVQSRDLLRTARREQISEGQDFTSYYISRPRSPIVAVTISYKFNNFRQNRRVAEGGMGDEEY
jgi:outer membrane receptor protein involved in Fe transport